MWYKKNSVYLDGASNTPVDPKVFKAMRPYLTGRFVGNTASTHEFGEKAFTVLENGRDELSKLIGCEPDEVYFTSGATEGNNWVIQGLALHEKIYNNMKKNHIIVSCVEHSSILNMCKELENWGFEIDYLPINKKRGGIVTAATLKQHLKSTTLLVCIMAVNNEIGSNNIITALGRVVQKSNAWFLCDCTQALSYGGKDMKIAERFYNVDYLTFSGHKIYGPTGTGCLIARKRAPLYCMIHGGSQEDGLRGGTVNLAGIVGLIEAYSQMSKHDYFEHYTSLYEYLLERIKEENLPIVLNVEPTVYSIISIRLETDKIAFSENYTFADALAVQGIACSSTSACDEKDPDEHHLSHVLKALGLSNLDIARSARLSFTKYNTKKDIDLLITAVKKIIA